MQVDYRIVEEITPERKWEVVGIIADWATSPVHLKLRSILQHTVSRSIWKVIQQRAATRQLTLETYHEALEEYSACYRILPQIHRLEGNSATEIRQQLRAKYLFARSTASEPVVASSSA